MISITWSGTQVARGDLIGRVFAGDQDAAFAAERALLGALTWSEEAVPSPRLLLEVIGPSAVLTRPGTP